MYSSGSAVFRGGSDVTQAAMARIRAHEEALAGITPAEDDSDHDEAYRDDPPNEDVYEVSTDNPPHEDDDEDDEDEHKAIFIRDIPSEELAMYNESRPETYDGWSAGIARREDDDELHIHIYRHENIDDEDDDEPHINIYRHEYIDDDDDNEFEAQLRFRRGI
ncbi:hypothetical protein SBOR_6713 [Sclerotinia borealis F-4128]|uniref:Uncharacterized protein n=1 Tax=Sclerotinia borealis (strain F-4128) TaxID=1432307 RepID=W9CDM5_SCLBF|nr:hypothetical protein SBOR_6713 [Sclerotinia borealis F-4128]